MQVEVNVIAKKYAISFLNLYFNQITTDYVEKLEKLKKFLQEKTLFYIYLGIPSISNSTKTKALEKLSKEFGLDESFRRLLFLLLNHGRIDILDNVIDEIIVFYRYKKNIEFFKVFSSHLLVDSEREGVVRFIKHRARGGVIARFEIDKKLIAGLRIQSDSFLWERSVAKQLRDVKRYIFKQVGLW